MNHSPGRPWQELVHTLRPVLRRTLRQPVGVDRGSDHWLPGLLLSAVDLWPQLPVDEQEVLHNALAQVAGLVLAHQKRQSDSPRETWPPCMEQTLPVR